MNRKTLFWCVVFLLCVYPLWFISEYGGSALTSPKFISTIPMGFVALYLLRTKKDKSN